MITQYERMCRRLINKLKGYIPHVNEQIVLDAFEIAEKAHTDQLFVSGYPYFEHCLHVAEILIDLKMDTETVIGGILHAITVDTIYSDADVRDMFGKAVADVVSGISQINNLKFKSEDIRHEDNLRRLVLSIAKDVRVIIIKFADRLHYLRAIDRDSTIHNIKIVSELAQETMTVYVPLAHRLGIMKIKQELEDLSFKLSNPETYESIRERVAESQEEQEYYISQIIAKLQKSLAQENIPVEIYGRPKSIYSIHRKMVNRGYSFDKINDLLAIRIIVKEGEGADKYRDCYVALGVLQNLFRPVQSLYTDYIQNPRQNGYQSIHIKVVYEHPIGDQFIEKIVEIQIRTDKMHEEAESGLAAHWLYKEGKRKIDQVDDKLIGIRQKIVEEASDPEKFIRSLKVDDLFEDEIFIFSPDRDLWQLPKGSTPVDFAYHVHTDLGFHCIGAKVDGKIVPLDYKLQSGQTVEIISSNAQRPNRDWLTFVKTGKARSKIRRWIRITEFEQSVKLGEELLAKALKHFHLKLSSDEMEDLARRCDFRDVQRFYEAIGRGDLTPQYIIKKLTPETLEDADDELLERVVHDVRGQERSIHVQGLDNLLINFGRCCNPVPGDAIIGFVSKGRGVVIHRTDCNNVARLLEKEDRNIDVKWAFNTERRFIARLNMVSENHRGFLKDVTNSLAKMNSNIISVDMKVEDTLVRNIMSVEVFNTSHLNRIINKVRQLKGVISVDRIDGNGNLTHSQANKVN
ncbi:bifunctional (p)ppGpp synthetase/guanosine-3',5'-bis(diphosphate) 3'-pyrophosphohydrolase [candidate division KSB1 bacterium]|nr:bifunctional (p)ppGpp synthetase/guanosine-3',5'-bis(diphosphate) 3'-pyrophosphohydrolase [candidate division KSB1 bacterium]